MLKVRINSFSYSFGSIPEDTCGNGGGFVFDCRYLDNPALYDEFRFHSGLDENVIGFFGENELMQKFLKNVFELVSDAVSVYQHRNYSDLMVNFGCTGGQHRSVYCAERLKSHLEKNFSGIKVVIKHHRKKDWIKGK